ncbi:Inner nuclear membrane protein SRC1 [Pleurostoma richardsiae]|uniref:Inner nuclear membrane protein SRC1 n=1 Tax=Pleurostoma richardsiae TaxID=41990 RepID=A0AA38VMW9_9PEZI|nr:Inner nuclear membrane protein SRC1 [Pleurostoma richardsiae]
MSDTESVDYLQNGFDPWSLTVPRLRSILVTYNISYPASAKKQQLVDIFNEQVVPQSKKILTQRARAKRSSQGIVDAESSQDTAISTDYDLMPPPASSTRAKSPRKSTRVKHESEELAHHADAAVSSPTKRKGRSTSRQAPPTSDTDNDAHADGMRSTRKSRRSVFTPEIKLEAPEEVAMPSRRSREPESVFTSDNPFQSGSSPPAPVKTPSTRRKTTGMESTKKRSSSAARRRTDGPVGDEDGSSTSRSFEIPLSRPFRPKAPESPAVEAGEEFTPEEQLELAQEDATRANSAVIPRRQKKSGSLATPFWVLLVTLLGAYAAWYRQEKIAVGYCGLGRPATQIIPAGLDASLPEWAVELVEPQCEPCPAHAYCFPDYSVRCENDFILKPHPLSLGGLVPLPPTCEPDGEKVRRVKAVADKAVEELRDRRAKYECGDLDAEEDHKPATPAVAEEVLKETISEKRSKKMSKREFDDLWAAALGEIEARDEVEVEVVKEEGTPGSGAVSTTLLSSSSLARLPLTCAVRRSIRLGVARHRLSIGSVVATVLAVLYARSQFKTYRATKAQIPTLVDTVLERLAAQKELAYEDGGLDDPFLFLPNLRDDVLRSVHSLAQRERIWSGVRAVVEQNSNVRTAQREGRNGEVGRAWEWIGPSSAGEASARRRKSGRVSWGPGVKSEEDSPAPEMAENRAAIHRKWDEPGSRPIY